MKKILLGTTLTALGLSALWWSTDPFTPPAPTLAERFDALCAEKNIGPVQRQHIEGKFTALGQALANEPAPTPAAKKALVDLMAGRWDQVEAYWYQRLQREYTDAALDPPGATPHMLGHARYIQARYTAALDAYIAALHRQEDDRRYQRAVHATFHHLINLGRDADYLQAAYLEAFEKINPNSADVPYLWNRLGLVRKEAGDYQHAITYLRRARAAAERILPADHPSLAAYDNNLGMAYQEMGDYALAAELIESALHSTTERLGEDDPSLTTYWNNLGATWQKQGDYPRAIAYYEKALRRDLQTLGDDHPDIAAYWNNLGSVYQQQGDHQRAVAYFEQALFRDIATYGDDHPEVAIDRNNLAQALRAQGDLEQAIDHLELALQIDLDHHGPDHPHIAIRYNNLGAAWQDRGDYAKAIAYYEQALERDLATYGPHHLRVANRCNNLGTAWQALGHDEKATRFYNRALDAFAKKLADDHPDVLKLKRNLASLEREDPVGDKSRL